TRLSGRPLRVVKGVDVPCAKRSSPPPDVPSQTWPARSPVTARIQSCDRPLVSEYPVKCPPLRRPRPPTIPIHRVPSTASNRHLTSLPGNPGVLLWLKTS